ncbi:MAG: hypothetical protein RL685_2062 [Pseudomonadota bacterium]
MPADASLAPLAPPVSEDVASPAVTLKPALGVGGVFVAAISYVIGTTTLVSDLAGWFSLGIWFALPLAAALALNVALALSVTELSSVFPRAGAIYSFTAAVLLPAAAAKALALFVALVLLGMIALGGVGEIYAGALSLKDLLGTPWDVRWSVAVLMATALLPNLLGIVRTAQASLVALVLLLGVRWLFGLIGFAGGSPSGSWSWSNVSGSLALADAGGPALRHGIGLAFWTFAGVEFVTPLAEETRAVPRAFPRGMLLALALIGLTSVVMGLGVSGTLSAQERLALAASPTACAGNCIHLAVGELMLGGWGRKLMALGAVASTYGTLVIGIAAVARIAYGVAREAQLSERWSKPLRRLSGKAPTPRTALLFATLLCTAPAMFTESVLDWILPAALLWLLLHAFYHLLVLIDRQRAPDRKRPFQAPLALPMAGLVGTLVAAAHVLPDADRLSLLARAACVLLGAALLGVLLSSGARRASWSLPRS